MKWMGLAIAAGAVGLWGGAAHAATSCADLTGLKLPHATVTGAAAQPAGAITACKVDLSSHPTADSDIHIEVWLPTGAAWNGRFVQLGNGGFAGQIASGRLASIAAQGYAVAMTDDGHEAEGTDGRWAIGHPDKVVDFGWRALKETTDLSKALILAYEAAKPQFSYFNGCSDGGREALMEAQRFPDDFDGIVAGAPAYNFAGLLTLAAANVQRLSKPGAYLDTGALQTLEAATLKACGGGAYVADQASCMFDPATTLCAAGETTGCLTADQVATAKAIYGGLPADEGGPYPGHSPGAEAEKGSWTNWTTGGSADQIKNSASYKFATGFWGGFVFGDPNYDVTKLDLATAAKARAAVAKEVDSTDPDLSRFRAHGGKLIQYHGWNDPAIPSRGSIVYYEEVRKTLGGDTSDFYKLYMVPGMLHCGGGASPTSVDWLGALRDWVEKHQAPEALIAQTVTAPGQPPAAGGPTQKLCPYPRKAEGEKCA